MVNYGNTRLFALLMATALLGWASGPAAVAVQIDARVQAGGRAVVGPTVSLRATSANAPARLAQSTTGAGGSFAVSVDQTRGGSILYLAAIGGTRPASKQGGNNPALALPIVMALVFCLPRDLPCSDF